jgi:putative peptidoglycan lipid II flippase
LSNLALNASGFIRQIIMAWILGLSSQIDLLLLAMIVPSIIQSMIGGGAGEIMVIKREKKGYSEGSFEALYILSCLIPVIILGLLYFLFLEFIIPFFDIDPASVNTFTGMSVIFLVNMVPGTFVSVLRPHLYSMGLYRFFSYSTIVSQAAGILFILVTVKRMGIWSFAYSYLFTSLLNSLWFSFRSKLYFPGIMNLAVWKHEASELIKLMKRVFSLSAQTLINHLATFWERSLSVKYLTPGYLSALNYSKTITELPNSVILSSVLTTSYIEQVRLHKESYSDFEVYTSRTLRLLLNAGFFLQIIMLILAPAIIIIIFRRGKFDNAAVETTLAIYNILTIGFNPKLVMNFFSRTMYILGEYRKLLIVIIFRVIVNIILMVFFINIFTNTIPAAAVTGFVLMSATLYLILMKKIELPGFGRFVIISLSATILSIGIIYLHSFTLSYYIGFSLPLFIATGASLIVFLQRHNMEPGIIKKIRRFFWKK